MTKQQHGPRIPDGCDIIPAGRLAAKCERKYGRGVLVYEMGEDPAYLTLDRLPPRFKAFLSDYRLGNKCVIHVKEEGVKYTRFPCDPSDREWRLRILFKTGIDNLVELAYERGQSIENPCLDPLVIKKRSLLPADTLQQLMAGTR